MMAARAEYKALRDLDEPATGARGYNEGDDIYADVVEAWGLEVGVDVEPSGEKVMAPPAKNDKRDDWARYALDQGIAPEDVDGMGRDELVAYFEEDKPADGG